MRKLLPLLLGTILLLGASGTAGQERKPQATLEEDWKILCRFQWVNSDPKEAWVQLEDSWKDTYTRKGSKGWSRIELSFKDGRPDKKEYRMTGGWYYLDGKGKEEVLPDLHGVVINLREEKGDRFLITRQGKGIVKYVLKEGVLILNGVDSAGESRAPTVYTGTYKGVERKEKK